MVSLGVQSEKHVNSKIGNIGTAAFLLFPNKKIVVWWRSPRIAVIQTADKELI